MYQLNRIGFVELRLLQPVPRALPTYLMKIRSARGAAKRGARTRACRAETFLGACWPMLTSKHKRRDEWGMRCGAQRRMKVGGVRKLEAQGYKVTLEAAA